MAKGDFMQVTLAEGLSLARCPVCSGIAEMWQYEGDEPGLRGVYKLVSCSHSESIGPQESLRAGCLLFTPPVEFYQATQHQAANFWNGYAAALVSLRNSRR